MKTAFSFHLPRSRQAGSSAFIVLFREVVHQLLRRCLGEGVGTEEVLHLDIRKARAREPSGELLASELRRIKGHGEDHLVNDLVERLPPPIVSQDSAR